MTMEDDNRPEPNSESEDSDAGWYFDLPKGAWERQEAKNRELRQNVRRNIDEAEPKKDVFGAPVRAGADEDAGLPAGWGAGLDEQSRPEPIMAESHVEESMEPPAPERPASPTAFRLRSQRLHDEEEQPLKPPPGLFGYTDAGRSADEIATEEPDLPVPEPPAERPRWRGLFNEKAADGASMLEGMRNWAHQSSGDAEGDGPAGGHHNLTDHEHTPPLTTPLPLRPQPQDVPEPAHPEAGEPQTRWDQMFSRKAGDDSGLLEGMRSWATKREDEPPAPRLRLAAEPEQAPEEMFEPFDWEADRPAPAAHAADFPAPASEEAGEKKGLFGKFFGKKKKQDEPPGETQDFRKAQDWFGDGTEEEAPAAQRGDWLGRSDGDENRFVPRARTPDSSEGDWVPESQASEAARTSGWALADDDNVSRPRFPRIGAMPGGEDDSDDQVIGGAAIDETRGADESWSPTPSVEDEARFSELSTWFANRNAVASEVDLSAPDPGEARSAAPAAELAIEYQTEPTFDLVGEDFVAPETPDAEPLDDEGWSPEPVTVLAEALPDTATPAVANSDAAEMDGWADDEPLESALPPPLAAVADEDPWGPADELDASADEIEATPPAPTSAIAASTPSEPDSDLLAAATETDDDDAWAQYIRGRLTDGDETPQSEPSAEVSPTLAPEWPSAGSTDSGAGWQRDASAEAPRESLWDSAFERMQGPDEDDAPAEPVSPAPPAARDSDDQWAAITRTTGYDEPRAPRATFEAASEANQEPGAPVGGAAFESVGAYDAASAGPGDDEAPWDTEPPPFVAPSAWDDEYEEPSHSDDHQPAPPPRYQPPEPEPFFASRPAAARPDWDEERADDDTVVRAFEAHAAMDTEYGGPPTADRDLDNLAFDDLLGDDAEEIVAEASQPPVDSRYFGRREAFAPQRAPGERQPYPWEVDDDQPARQPAHDDGEEIGGDGWGDLDGGAPPWATDPATAASGHAGAPSVRRKSRSRVLVREIVETGLLALLVFLSVRASFQNFKVDGYSMWPTLDDGEYLIVNKLAYAEVDMDRLSNFVPFVDPGDDPTREIFGGPARGDIVVLKDPRETDTDLIKRIIGMPGETLEIVDGKVYINDHLLVEPYIKEEWNDDKDKIAIPDGFYFVMGDNRNNSMDSRSSQIALIPKDLIIGKAMLTYWPSSRFGLAPNDGGDISEKDGRPVVTAERVAE